MTAVEPTQGYEYLLARANEGARIYVGQGLIGLVEYKLMTERGFVEEGKMGKRFVLDRDGIVIRYDAEKHEERFSVVTNMNDSRNVETARMELETILTQIMGDDLSVDTN